MLRARLLTTTILMIVGSVSFAAAQSAGISGDRPGDIGITAAGSTDSLAPTQDMRKILGNPGKDRNMEFLCTYGYDVYYNKGGESGSDYTDWRHYAVPIRGEGASVSEIIVTDSPGAGTSSFKVGIYKSRNGRPAELIVAGTGQARGSCLRTTVVIPKTFLAAGKKYWIEENASRGHVQRPIDNAVNWGYNPNARHNAYSQYYSYSSSDGGSSSYLSDWLPVSGPAPFVKVK